MSTRNIAVLTYKNGSTIPQGIPEGTSVIDAAPILKAVFKANPYLSTSGLVSVAAISVSTYDLYTLLSNVKVKSVERVKASPAEKLTTVKSKYVTATNESNESGSTDKFGAIITYTGYSSDRLFVVGPQDAQHGSWEGVAARLVADGFKGDVSKITKIQLTWGDGRVAEALDNVKVSQTDGKPTEASVKVTLA